MSGQYKHKRHAKFSTASTITDFNNEVPRDFVQVDGSFLLRYLSKLLCCAVGHMTAFAIHNDELTAASQSTVNMVPKEQHICATNPAMRVETIELPQIQGLNNVDTESHIPKEVSA